MKYVAMALLALGLMSGFYQAFMNSGITVDFGPATVLVLASIAVRLIWSEPTQQ